MRRKKHIYNKSTGRDYKYDTAYQSSPSQKKNRAARNRARNEIKKHLEAIHGKTKAAIMLHNMDVDHKKAISKGGAKNKRSNLRLISKSKNRGKDRPTGKRKRSRR